MKRIVRNTLALLMAVAIVVSLMGCKKEDNNDDAAKDKRNRYLTLINETGAIINEIHVTVGEGTEIESMARNNPEASSISIKIPKEFAEYDTFVVVFIDRHGLKYQKEVTNVDAVGMTEVRVDKDDYVKQKGDGWRKIQRFFNGGQ